MTKKIVIRYAFLAAVFLGIGCSKEPAISGTEVTNGNCIGKIYHQDGSAVEGASVKLIPTGYNPYTHEGEFVDSTFTDKNGDYAFRVSRPDYYNIVAEKGSASCMQDSVFVQAYARTIVDDDTLQESGTLSGIVRLKPGDDSRQVVILVLGTNVYVVPPDTSGRFATPSLPKGNYAVRIFTTLDGYAVFDTNVAVREGTPTMLDITLPSANAPTVADLTAVCDSSTMVVTLSWPQQDTSKIVSLALYRNSSMGNDTLAIVDKSATSYTDDAVSLDGDSVTYRIAGIGKNYREGYRTAARPIVVCGMIRCIKKIDVSRIGAGLPDIGYVDIFSDREDEIFLTGNRGIFKLDSNGVVREDFFIGHSDTSQLSGNLQGDNFGHLFIFRDRSDTPAVIKFDRDLNILAETKLPLDTGYGRSIVVSGNGTMYSFSFAHDATISPPSGYYTVVTTYDSTYTVLNSFPVFNRQVHGANLLGNTIVTYEYPIPTNDQPGWLMHFYDTAFTPLSVFDPADFDLRSRGNPRFDNQIYSADQFIAAPNGLFVSVFHAWEVDGDFSLLIFTDRNGKFLARIVVPGIRGLSFDSFGNLYFITYRYSEINEASSYENPMKTIFKYSMKPLLKKIGL
jgi:hypothetical protein